MYVLSFHLTRQLLADVIARCFHGQRVCLNWGVCCDKKIVSQLIVADYLEGF